MAAAGIISTVLDQLGSILLEELKQRGRLVIGAESDVRNMSGTLKSIRALLKDAEQRQLTEESVKLWVRRLDDVSFEIDDVLDEWSTAILRRRVEGGGGKESELNWVELQLRRVSDFVEKVCPFFPFAFAFVSFDDVGLRHDIGSKIKELNERLDEIDKEKSSFQFSISRVSDDGQSVDLGRNRKMTSAILGTAMKGRDEEKGEVIQMLVSESGSSSAIEVVSIVGMGGLGKTTLAKSVYNEVGDHFDKRIWVCVSDPFDELRIAKAILGSLLGKKTELNELSAILEEIYSNVSQFKYFLVLDDAWEADFGKWEELLGSLGSGKAGSRILVTTRKKSVAAALFCSEDHMVQLRPLSDEACWSVFQQHAFLGWNAKDRELVEELGKEIVRTKCDGLPLTAKTIGSFLRLKKSRRQWKDVLDSDVWKLEATIDLDLFAPLWLSYYDLSSELKKCFAFCSVFPKDSVIEKDKLIRLWMAQGYLGAASKQQDLDLIGETYFENLVMRSFFQDLGEDDELVGSKVTCTMHDLVRDFARFVSSNKGYCLKTADLEQSKMESMDKKARHLTVLPNPESELPCCIRLKILKITTFKCTHPPIDHTGNILPNVLDLLTSLRSLCLSGCGLQSLPAAISKLIHLRLLDLSLNNDLAELPDELCDLYNLQTLDVSLCGYLKRMPQNMEKLVNLLHLLNYKVKWAQFPQGIGKLLGLKTLLEFDLFVGPNIASLRHLQNLNQLEGSLRINRLGSSSNHVDETEEAQLEKKTKITVLTLEFDFEEESVEWRIARDEKLIEALKPSGNLEVLSIMYYQGAKLSPTWMPLLTNLTRLTFVNCINCATLPSLGELASLEYLELRDLPMKKVGREFLGGIPCAFPKLTELHISHCGEWDEWEEWDGDDQDIAAVMPCLCRLSLTDCDSLKKLPDQLVKNTTLEQLNLQWCDALTSWYSNSEERAKLAHIPIVNIT